MMEVVTSGERAGGGQLPFQRRNVQEWSRIDELTGMLEHARVETDHWAASTSNSSHHFGKVVDSRSRNTADGGSEQRHQTKQLEVFQAHIPGGSVQVIRSHTSTSSSWHGQHKISSGRWDSSNSEVPALPSVQHRDFDNLKLAINPLDLSSQKTKASVCRSGSISSRRPPSRPRSIASIKHDDIIAENKESRLSELSRITHQIHAEAKEKLFNNSAYSILSNKHYNDETDTNDFPYTFEGRNNKINSTHEVAKSSSESTISSHPSLTRKKSCSSEDLYFEQDKERDTESDRAELNRASRVRRSLQFPVKTSVAQKVVPVVPLTKSVSQIKEEIEARKQIVSSVLKTNQWNNLGELKDVLGVVTNGHDADIIPPSSPTKKRHSFITVESLKEVKGRLRKLSSTSDDQIKPEEIDDGIVTEVKSDSPVPDKMEELSRNSVKSYVFGMEAVLRNGKQPVLGTGSLESRSSNKANANCNKTEEWYNRRKSYGFEQVNGQQTNHHISIEKNKVDSSTDSGICRSSETMTFPTWVKPDENKIKTTYNIVIKPDDLEQKNISEIESGAIIPAGRKTVVTLGSGDYNQSNWNWNEEVNHTDKETVPKGKIADALRKLREKSTSFESHRLSEPITISIPIQQSPTNITDPKSLLLKQTKNLEKLDATQPALQDNAVTSYSHLLYGHTNEKNSEINGLQNNPTSRTKTLMNWFDTEQKRHSIAVDEAKYLSNSNKSFSSQYHHDNNKINNLAISDSKQTNNASNLILVNADKDGNKYSGESDYEMNGNEKKHKKVEFCKTEVHFAAEPGRFNIVETDGKPPPSNMYRRRKKTSDSSNRSSLPEIRFGDSPYEKNLLTGNENNDFDSDKVKPLTFRGSPAFSAENHTTVNSSCTYLSDSSQEEHKEPQVYSEDEALKPRSILKNNIPKPRPYLLGENDEPAWGVKLKSVQETVKTNEVVPVTNSKETEFQKLLRSLRPTTKTDFTRPVEPSAIAADNGLEVRISSSSVLPDQRRASWSVADRIRHVEDLRTKGYLTKVNFGVGEAVVIGSDVEELPRKDSVAESSWIHSERDAVPHVTSHSVYTFAPTVAQAQEHVFNNSPKITSVALNVNKPSPEPTTFYNKYEHSNVRKTSCTEIIGSVEQSENGTRIWSFSKNNLLSDRKSPTKLLIETNSSQNIEKIKSPLPKIEPLVETDKNTSRSSQLIRSSPSPSRDLLVNKNTPHVEPYRHRSLSPNITHRTIKKHNEDLVEKTSQTEPEYVNIKKDVKSTQTSYRQTTQSHARNVKKKDSKYEHKSINDMKRKERKLSTSSSGRDGWLNTPKEPQARQRSETFHRRVETKKETTSNSSKQVKQNQPGSESPIYQNREVFAKKDKGDRSETESAILEELTRAADEILLAVNGYTDEDSFRGSSDDEYRKRREKLTSKPLCTIAETPNKKTNSTYKRTSLSHRTKTVDVQKDVKSRCVGKTSSNSSMDSGPVDVRPLLTSEDRSKRRAARLLQRANSRELLLQTAASSSEDIGSGSEAGNVRRQRIVRRTRTQGTRSSTSTQQTAISHRSTTASESRTRDRVQRTSAITDKSNSKKQTATKRTKTDEKPNYPRPVTGPVKCEKAERRSLAMTSSSHPPNVLKHKKSYTSQSEESAKSRD